MALPGETDDTVMMDAIVVGSGPNGLAAALRLAQEGLSVRVLESEPLIGGGTRTLELTEPGFLHDICSAIHPMGISSPFLKSLPLEKHGLEWIHPEVPLAHPLEGDRAILLHHELERMKEELETDYPAWERLFRPLKDSWGELPADLLAPLRFPRHPLQMARFGLQGLRSAEALCRRFKEGPARALFAGLAAHSQIPLDRAVTAAIGLVFGASAHGAGWPLARGGSAAITRAMASLLQELGGEIETGTEVRSLEMLPPARAILFDLTPQQLLRIAGSAFPASYRRRLERFRYGAGVFKIDYILREPVPWRDPRCNQAGTVHVGGTLEEIAKAEREVALRHHPEKPFVLTAQQSLFDPTRTPDNRHTFWAYCHVPNGSTVDMTRQIEDQIERFAPGFRDLVDRRVVRTAARFQTYNANYIGGDINGGVQDLRQLFTRPAGAFQPYATPVRGLYICSSSTPPGGGVHGMCGYHAAEAVLRKEFGRSKGVQPFALDSP